MHIKWTFHLPLLLAVYYKIIKMMAIFSATHTHTTNENQMLFDLSLSNVKHTFATLSQAHFIYANK